MDSHDWSATKPIKISEIGVQRELTKVFGKSWLRNEKSHTISFTVALIEAVQKTNSLKAQVPKMRLRNENFRQNTKNSPKVKSLCKRSKNKNFANRAEKKVSQQFVTFISSMTNYRFFESFLLLSRTKMWRKMLKRALIVRSVCMKIITKVSSLQLNLLSWNIWVF